MNNNTQYVILLIPSCVVNNELKYMWINEGKYGLNGVTAELRRYAAYRELRKYIDVIVIMAERRVLKLC